MAPGSGLLKMGEASRGLLSRWYPETIVSRISAVHSLRGRLSFAFGDGLEAVAKQKHNAHTAIFADPPYTTRNVGPGQRLYRVNHVDHEKLFELLSLCRGATALTYHQSDEVCRLAQRYRMSIALMRMTNTHHRHQFELLILKGVLPRLPRAVRPATTSSSAISRLHTAASVL